MHTVHLVLKHKYYGAIDRGEKTVEYRDNTDYWRKRILNKRHVTFHRGYTKEIMVFEIDYLVVPEINESVQIEIHLGKRVCKRCGREITNPYWRFLGVCSRSCHLKDKKENKRK